MAAKELPEFLKRARRNAMKRIAAQLAGASEPVPARAEPGDDGFESGIRPAPVILSASGHKDDVEWDQIAASRKYVAEEAHRPAVLATAVQLFSNGGYRRVTLEDVARQAGISRAVLGTLFPTKEALLLDAVASEVERFLAEARTWISPHQPAHTLLRTIATRAFEYMGHRPLVMQLMLGLLAELAPERVDQLEALRTRFITVIRDALQIGIEQRAFRTDLDLDMTAAVLFDLHVSSYLIHQRAPSDKAEVATRRREAALDLVLNGLRVR